jgi:hypothetical protein
MRQPAAAVVLQDIICVQLLFPYLRLSEKVNLKVIRQNIWGVGDLTV